MEPTAPSPPDPAFITPERLDASSTNVTAQPNDDPRWPEPKPTPSVSSAAVPVGVVGLFAMLGMCILGALLGSWVMLFVGVVIGLMVFHYFAWGWVLSRSLAEQQREELLKLAEQDAKRLPDPQRSRHF